MICCHRAVLSGRFPPNSLGAVDECVAAGVPRLEIDVRFLSDDAMLIFHEAELDAETTGSGQVGALERAGAGLLRYLADEDHSLCFLEEVADRVRGSETLLQVDLKLMRPISGARVELLAEVLAPVRDHVLIGSQAHWNLRPFVERGFLVALDPTLQWHYAPGRDPSLTPTRLGVHGLWDDSPLAGIRHATAREYMDGRIADLVGLLPSAVEWMVDLRTIGYFSSLGFAFGEELAGRGIALAAWTLHDTGPGALRRDIEALVGAGSTTIIADDVPAIARAAALLAAPAL